MARVIFDAELRGFVYSKGKRQDLPIVSTTRSQCASAYGFEVKYV
jgi:hypothetical protein